MLPAQGRALYRPCSRATSSSIVHGRLSCAGGRERMRASICSVILGRNLLFLDIGTFVLAVLVGQTVSALLEIRNFQNSAFLTIGLALLVMQIIAYGSFTFHPPDHWLFTDSRNGLLGLPRP